MHSIDMHCDTLMVACLRKKDDIFEMPGSVDLKRLKESGAVAQFFAIFMLPEAAFGMMNIPYSSDEDYIALCGKVLRESLEAHKDMASQARTAEEIRANLAAGKVSAVLTMEDGRAVDGKMENIKRFYDMGVRALSLTWNAPNCFGYPNSRDPEVMARGLTDFGKEAIGYMQELGMLVDVSHLSDGGFRDVADICKKPFVATHSNCRALSPHQRNLTDDMLRRLGEAGGVAGINFGPEFLNADVSCKASTAALMARHARHMADVAGIDAVALGSDFDGIEGELEVDSPLKMGLLEYALRKEGFTESEIEKIARLNVLRVMDEAVR